MCLKTIRVFPLRSDKDIKVFKVVRKFRDYYFSPYVDLPLMEEPEEQEFNKRPMPVEFRGIKADGFWIFQGAIHAFVDKMSAEEFAYSYNMSEKKFARSHKNVIAKSYVVIEGTIPAGTEYYDSVDGKGICSRKIVFDKKYLKCPKDFWEKN